MYCTYFQLKGFLNREKRGVLNHGTIEWFLFYEVKASKTCQQTLTNIRAKNKNHHSKQKKIKRCLLIGLQCFFSQS